MSLRGDYFKPIEDDFGLTAKAACDHPKRPEVNVITSRRLEKPLEA